jgi:glutathione peroxidase
MTSLLDAFTPRKLPAPLLRAGVLLGILNVSIAGCKATEAGTAAEPAAPGEAAPGEAVPSEAAAQPAEPGAMAASPAPTSNAPPSPGAAAGPSIHSFTMTRLDGTETALSAWAGKVVLVVNTASKCGYTPQYQGLQQLHTKYSERGFEVLGFPSNDFGGQEPGTSEEISKFCITMYDVNFPMFEKIKVLGQERSPLYALLSDAYGEPKWNFHKYLVDKKGKPVQAWPSKVEPGSPEIAAAIEAQLAL